MKSEELETSSRNQSAPLIARRHVARAALLLSLFAILFLREPRCITHPEFWAEDGTMFFRQQLLYGSRALLFTAGGYLDAVARLLALIASLFPVAWTPLLYAMESILVAGVCCWVFVLDEFRGLLRSDLLRGILCVMSAAAFPSQELIGNLTNVQWFFSLVAVPLTLAPPECRSAVSRGLFTVLGLLISLSAPLTIILLPLIALRAFRVRKMDWFGMAITVGTLVEWAVIARHWAHPATVHGGLLPVASALAFTTLVAFTNQVMMFSLLGRHAAESVWAHGYDGFSLLLLLAAACIAVVLYRSASTEYRRRMEIFLWLIFSSLALAMLRGMESVFPRMSSVQPYGSHRYYLLACWSFAFLVGAAIVDRKPDWPQRAKAVLMGVIFLTGAIGNFKVTSQFADEWRAYAPAAQAWQTDHAAGRQHPEVIVPISPKGWVVDLPKLTGSQAQ